jgi:hypothetical protein
VNSQLIVMTVIFRLLHPGSPLKRVDNPFWGQAWVTVSQVGGVRPSRRPQFSLLLERSVDRHSGVKTLEFRRQGLSAKKAW